MNVFEIAAKEKYRFETEKGMLCVEDLFTLPIKSERNNLDLYTIAKSLSEGMGKTDNELISGIFSEETKVDTVSKNKFEIVQRIVEIKRADNKSRMEKATKKAEREKLMDLIAKKQDESLESLSLEALQEKLDRL